MLGAAWKGWWAGGGPPWLLTFTRCPQVPSGGHFELFKVGGEADCQRGERLVLSKYLGHSEPFHHLVATQVTGRGVGDGLPELSADGGCWHRVLCHNLGPSLRHSPAPPPPDGQQAPGRSLPPLVIPSQYPAGMWLGRGRQSLCLEPSNPSIALPPQFSVFVLDERFPLVPVLRWEHMMQRPPIYAHFTPTGALQHSQKVLLGTHLSQELLLLQYSGGDGKQPLSTSQHLLAYKSGGSSAKWLSVQPGCCRTLKLLSCLHRWPQPPLPAPRCTPEAAFHQGEPAPLSSTSACQAERPQPASLGPHSR